jgi:hemolysin III
MRGLGCAGAFISVPPSCRWLPSRGWWGVAATPRAELAAWVYGLSAIACYATSGIYHVFARSPVARRRWRQADHAMIYVLIAGTATPMYLLAASGMWRWVMFGLMWAGAGVGITLKLVSIERFRVAGGVLYIGLGWMGLALIPNFWDRPRLLMLVVVAGVTYTVGAVLFAQGRPNPIPRWFGYHEVWHTLGVAAGCGLLRGDSATGAGRVAAPQRLSRLGEDLDHVDRLVATTFAGGNTDANPVEVLVQHVGLVSGRGQQLGVNFGDG